MRYLNASIAPVIVIIAGLLIRSGGFHQFIGVQDEVATFVAIEQSNLLIGLGTIMLLISMTETYLNKGNNNLK